MTDDEGRYAVVTEISGAIYLRTNDLTEALGYRDGINAPGWLDKMRAMLGTDFPDPGKARVFEETDDGDVEIAGEGR